MGKIIFDVVFIVLDILIMIYDDSKIGRCFGGIGAIILILCVVYRISHLT